MLSGNSVAWTVFRRGLGISDPIAVGGSDICARPDGSPGHTQTGSELHGSFQDLSAAASGQFQKEEFDHPAVTACNTCPVCPACNETRPAERSQVSSNPTLPGSWRHRAWAKDAPWPFMQLPRPVTSLAAQWGAFNSLLLARTRSHPLAPSRVLSHPLAPSRTLSATSSIMPMQDTCGHR
ncbi:hypothetical protein K432DRAFT_438828 [Lepidopterella palustris CBS 459.81]|uniref:Uncharacterized protein n=1 Tax=Lepidopterella palustris CBS 459.81 TaxID=1314670 RepID=A0A8E2ELC7_9PEZI|nr:hypothetical protein K432DRAFT_438828 [Lepidopterella palustris CBS 459.81]